MVRHGATVLSAEDRFAGATDVALSDEGREQTRRLADRLSHEKIKAVSPVWANDSKKSACELEVAGGRGFSGAECA